MVNACDLLGADTGSIGLSNLDETAIKIEAVHNMPVVELGSEWGPGDGLAGSMPLGMPMAPATSSASIVLPVPGSPLTSSGRLSVMDALTASIRSWVAT